MRVSLKNIVAPTIPIAVISIIGCFVLWIISYYATPVITDSLTGNESHWIIFNSLFLSNLLGAGVTLMNAFLLAQINNRFTLIRTRTFLPIIIFVLLMSAWTDTHLFNESHITLSLFMFSLFYFFSMFREPNSVEQAYMGSFLIGVSSIILNSMIFLIPIFWVGFIMFQSFSLRTFLASVFGILTPWILFISALYLFDSSIDLHRFFDFDFSQVYDFQYFSFRNLGYILSLLVILLITLLGLISNTRSDATHTRIKLNFLIVFMSYIIILAGVFFKQFGAFLPLIGLCYALLSSHSFTLKENDFFGILFIVFCAINVMFVLTKYIAF
jgi:hypothetical protein